ncbi:hypothetical protein BJ742DRAFT_814962 [Cladochytrium replicatum]|nr:hypothetical protein BJ742DRAFT_814962 [Cladochytrium replicatum]
MMLTLGESELPCESTVESLKNAILYAEVSDFLLGLESSVPLVPEDPPEPQMSLDPLVLHLADAANELSGLTELLDVPYFKQVREELPSEITEVIRTQIERRLRSKCLFLGNFLEGKLPESADQSSKSGRSSKPPSPSRSSEIADSIRILASEVEELNNECWEQRQALLNAFREYTDTHLEFIHEAVNFLDKYPYGTELGRHDGFNSYFDGVINGMHLKLRCIELECILHASTGEVGEILSEIRERMGPVEAEVGQRTQRVERMLLEYRTGSGEFEGIASEYVKVMKDIKTVERDLARMRT